MGRGQGQIGLIAASDVKSLRQQTGAGMMDCKKALVESHGDVDQAIKILQVKQGKKIQSLAQREVSEGAVQAYVHPTGKIGVLVDVGCNTDFVAKNEDFTSFSRAIAMQIAATPTVKYVTREEIPEDAIEQQRSLYQQQAARKPQHVREKFIDGKMEAWFRDVVLLEQKMYDPKYEGKTVQQLKDDLTAVSGENIIIRSFARLAIG